jgi:hypothetical protein
VNYVVLSDCQGAVDRFRHERVEWRSRGQMRLANDFFDKVLRRAAYLRGSHDKVVRRRPLQPHQKEAFELFNAPSRKFTLSSSQLWLRVLSDAGAHPDTLGIVPGH